MKRKQRLWLWHITCKSCVTMQTNNICACDDKPCVHYEQGCHYERREYGDIVKDDDEKYELLHSILVREATWMTTDQQETYGKKDDNGPPQQKLFFFPLVLDKRVCGKWRWDGKLTILERDGWVVIPGRGHKHSIPYKFPRLNNNLFLYCHQELTNRSSPFRRMIGL